MCSIILTSISIINLLICWYAITNWIILKHTYCYEKTYVYWAYSAEERPFHISCTCMVCSLYGLSHDTQSESVWRSSCRIDYIDKVWYLLHRRHDSICPFCCGRSYHTRCTCIFLGYLAVSLCDYDYDVLRFCSSSRSPH